MENSFKRVYLSELIDSAYKNIKGIMENTKEVKITPPKGWEIDVEKSNLKECRIVYKEKKKETFEDAMKHCDGNHSVGFNEMSKSVTDKIEALGKMAIVAEYMNDPSSKKTVQIRLKDECVDVVGLFNIYTIGFTSKEAAQRAINILGEDIIRRACR